MAFKDAGSCPPGTDQKLWEKTYNAADSRMYRRMGKDASKSAIARASGETRRLALKMLAQSVLSSVQTSSAVPSSSAHQSVMNSASKSNATVSDKAKTTGIVHSLPQCSSKLSSTITSSQPGKLPSNSMALLPQKRKLATAGMHLPMKRNKASPLENQATAYANALERKLQEMETLWAAIDEAEATCARAEAKVSTKRFRVFDIENTYVALGAEVVSSAQACHYGYGRYN